MKSDTMKLPAMTKHPIGTASYHLRVATPGGSFWQACATEPRPIDQTIASMEEQIAIMRKMIAPKSDNADDEPTRMAV